MACSCLNFSIQKTHQNCKKMVGFVSNCLEENDFVAVLVNFCCYEYGANASEAVQKQRLAQGHCWSYDISLKHLIL